MKHSKIIWVVIADGARARIFIRKPIHLEQATVMDYVGDHRLNQQALPDRPGRCFERSGTMHHAYEPHTDWHEYQKHLFAKELCILINAAAQRKDFDALILVAPPKTLGELRQNLIHEAYNKIQQEIPKDLTKIPLHELAGYLDHHRP